MIAALSRGGQLTGVGLPGASGALELNLARRLMPVFVGHLIDQRTLGNAVLWDRLHGAGRDAAELWTFRGVTATLQQLKALLTPP